MEVPNFLKLENNSLLYNKDDDSELVFYVSEDFFDNKSKNAIAEIVGQYVSMIGLCDWAIIDKNGKRGELRAFNFPTMFLCKPYTIEKVKGLVLDSDKEPKDYRLLKFRKGDEVISQTKVPQIIDNVEMFFRLSVLTAKIPSTVPYNEGWKLFNESMELNGNSFGIHSQLFGLTWLSICRDPNDISQEFRYSDIKDMHGYKPISIKLSPKYISPYTSVVSEGWDEAIMAAILMKDKKDIPDTPLEKIITR